MLASDFGNRANYRKMVLLLVQMRVPRQQHLSNAVPVVFLKAFVDDLLVDDDIYGGDEQKNFLGENSLHILSQISHKHHATII